MTAVLGLGLMGPALSSNAATCQWETDNFGYDRVNLGPLFDYAPSGKFKAGLLNVNEVSLGLLVEVYHVNGTPDRYYVEEGSFAMTSGTIRAVSYR